MYNFRNVALILMMIVLVAISVLIILAFLIAILCGKENRTKRAWLIGAIVSICWNSIIIFILNDAKVNYDDYLPGVFLIMISIPITVALVYYYKTKKREQMESDNFLEE